MRLVEKQVCWTHSTDPALPQRTEEDLGLISLSASLRVRFAQWLVHHSNNGGNVQVCMDNASISEKQAYSLSALALFVSPIIMHLGSMSR